MQSGHQQICKRMPEDANDAAAYQAPLHLTEACIAGLAAAALALAAATLYHHQCRCTLKDAAVQLKPRAVTGEHGY